MAHTKRSIWGFSAWIGEARKSIGVDLIAGITLWAMIVPEAVAYGNMAGAPTAAAGLYGIIIGLPIYALFASSRFEVATSTAAVSVTMAGLLAALSANGAGSFAAMVIAAGLIFFIFWYFRMGFVADFISEPVSRGFMIGLSIFIVVGQLPKVLGVEKGKGNTFEQAWSLLKNLGDANLATLITGLVVLVVIVGAEKLRRRIPGSLLALAGSIVVFYVWSLGDRFKIDMVGKLPEGLPQLTMPTFTFADLPVLIPGAIGLVIVSISEATVLAASLAIKHGQKLDTNQQFFAFGAANVMGGLFGGLMSCGSTSSTLVNHDAGAKTLMSTVWAAAATLLTAMFLTGLFAYVPEAFLGVLIIHAVWHVIKFRRLMTIRHYSVGDFNLAAITMLAVLLFDVLNGLIVAMALNVLYFAYKASVVKVEQLGTLNDSDHTLMPTSFPNVQPTPKETVALGITKGQLFYASANSALNQAQSIIDANPDAKNIVMSVARMDNFDFTSIELLRRFEDIIRQSGKHLYITDLRSEDLYNQLQEANLDPEAITVKPHMDVTKLT